MKWQDKRAEEKYEFVSRGANDGLRVESHGCQNLIK